MHQGSDLEINHLRIFMGPHFKSMLNFSQLTVFNKFTTFNQFIKCDSVIHAHSC